MTQFVQKIKAVLWYNVFVSLWNGAYRNGKGGQKLRLTPQVSLSRSDLDSCSQAPLSSHRLCQEKCASYFLTYTLYFTSSYLAFRSEKPCYSDSLFLTMEREPITSNAIKMLFQRLKISSGISLLYPHLLRHTFATNYIIRAVILKYSGSYSVIVLSQSLKYIFIWLHKCN